MKSKHNKTAILSFISIFRGEDLFFRTFQKVMVGKGRCSVVYWWEGERGKGHALTDVAIATSLLRIFPPCCSWLISFIRKVSMILRVHLLRWFALMETFKFWYWHFLKCFFFINFFHLVLSDKLFTDVNKLTRDIKR